MYPKTTLISYVLYVSLYILSNSISAQSITHQIQYAEIDSLNMLYHAKCSDKAYRIQHQLLKRSNTIDYKKGVLNVYRSLMFYHGKKRDLDSTLYYSNLFESKVALEKLQPDERPTDSTLLSKYYLTKGVTLFHRFGLTEQGLEAHLKGRSLIPENDFSLLTYYETSLAKIYNRKKAYEQSINVLLPKLRDTSKINYKTKKRLLQTIANTYTKKEMPEKSNFFNAIVLKMAEKKKDTRQILWAKKTMVENYNRMGEYQKALDSLLVLRKRYSDHYDDIFEYNHKVMISNSYYGMGDIDNAIFHSIESLKFKNPPLLKVGVYERLCQYYAEKKLYKKYIEINNKKDKILDSIRIADVAAYSNYITSSTKLFDEKHKSQQMHFDMQLLEEKNKKQKSYLLSTGIAFVTLLLLIGSILLFRKYQKGEKQIEELKLSEKKLLEEKIILRENELEASAIALSQRIETLNVINNELNIIKNPHISELEPIKKKIKDLIRASNESSILTDRIESQYPTITTELKTKHPNLSDTEIRYCLLTKLNLSIKETATILNVTPDTVKVARSRLKKKMGIPTNIPFKVFLDDLSSVH